MNRKGLVLMAALGFAGAANAGLIDRGNGLIYDDVLNITWLQDANYAQTSGYDSDGVMTWDAAVAWADGLVYGGYDDWRLPTITDTGAPGCNWTYSGTDCGYNVNTATSELAYMFHVNLGNLSALDSLGTQRGGSQGVNWGLVNKSFTDAATNASTPILNLGRGGAYWSDTEDASHPIDAWSFATSRGYQYTESKGFRLLTWAVRDGDVAASSSVPEPATFALLGLGLAGLGIMQRSKAGRSVSATV